MEDGLPRLRRPQTWTGCPRRRFFKNAFCTNSICSPSRACVLTGQYNHVNGAVDLGGRVEPGKQMLAIEMGKAGYQSAMIGKWHLKVEPKDFDYYCVLPGTREIPRPFLPGARGEALGQKPHRVSQQALHRCHHRPYARMAEGPQKGQALLPHAPLQGTARLF